jgi:1-acyl-sn-glycerol-3-phosphate acyltransferase
MKKAWLAVRSALLWAVSGLHFFLLGAFLVLLGVFVDPRKNDRPQRFFFRNILRLAGVRFEVIRSAGFDPQCTSIFICNHVNLFDPFVIYSAIPQFVRGFELESHFRIPVYGWMMGRFGNVPVPDRPSREGLDRMTTLAKRALDSGVSLIAFPEAGRTRDGHVDEFKSGVFRLAQRFETPIVPMSIMGSFEFFRTGDWLLHPGKITVHLFDTIETKGLTREEMNDLRESVRSTIAISVEEHLHGRPATKL